MNYRSHTKQKIQEALQQDRKVFRLDTDGDGLDDHLIGDIDEVITDIKAHYDLDEIPSHWTLTRVDWEI